MKHSQSAGQVTPGLAALHALCDAQNPAPSTYNDVETVEDGPEGEDDISYFLALQRQINSGLIWRLQGSAGRAAMDAINTGYCILGKTATTDFYGTPVPGRLDVKRGTKGSFAFAAKLHGQPYARTLARE